MEKQLSLEVKEKMSDDDFIEIGFRMQEKFYNPGILKRFAQGDFIFRFCDKHYILSVEGEKAELLINDKINKERAILDVTVNDKKTWIKIAQRVINPVKALLTKRIRIGSGGIKGFLIYKYCFVSPYCNKTEIFKQQMRSVPDIKKISKVVVLNASPRKHGSTVKYLNAFLEGIRNAGAQVEIINVYEKKINHCRGCYNCCVVTPGRCIFSDDIQEIIPAIESCDLWLNVFPTYVGNIPSGLQKVFERLLCLVYPQGIRHRGGLSRHPRRNKPHAQYMAGLNVYGFSEFEQSKHLYDHLKDVAHHASFDYLGLVRINNAIVKAINRQVEPVLENDLTILRNLGMELVLKKTLNKGMVRNIDSNTSFSVNETLYTVNVFLDLLEEQFSEKEESQYNSDLIKSDSEYEGVL